MESVYKNILYAIYHIKAYTLKSINSKYLQYFTKIFSASVPKSIERWNDIYEENIH